MSSTIAAAPNAISGRTGPGTSTSIDKTTPPNTTTMTTGTSSIILASGAGVSDRSAAAATAEACSDTHGSRHSTIRTRSDRGAAAGAGRRCPVSTWPV